MLMMTTRLILLDMLPRDSDPDSATSRPYRVTEVAQLIDVAVIEPLLGGTPVIGWVNTATVVQTCCSSAAFDGDDGAQRRI